MLPLPIDSRCRSLHDPASRIRHAPSGRSLLVLLVGIGVMTIVTVTALGTFRNGRDMPPTLVASPNLENATGTLRLRVFDARGEPVEGASVHIANSDVTPPITLTLPTDTRGEVVLPGVPPSTAGYHVRVTRDGYSTDTTVAPSAENPNPTSPPLTVRAHEVRTADFTIDRLSSIVFTFRQHRNDQPFRGLTMFTLQGQKTVGVRRHLTPPPDTLPIYKSAPQSFTTNQGTLTISNLEWDTYQFEETMPDDDLTTADPPLPIVLLPGTAHHIAITFAPHRNRTASSR